MAETYRGLTIRIGGDATSLQKALQSVTGSIKATESQLRRMKQALNMDPGNTDAVATNLRLVGQRAVESQRRLRELKRALEDVSGQKVDLFGGTKSVQTVRELANATEDANQRAADAKRNYAAVCEELAKLYAPIDRAARRMDEFGDDFKTSDLVRSMGLDGAIDRLREFGLITDDTEDAMRRLNAVYHEAFDENEVAKAVAKMSDLEVEISKADAEAKSLANRFSELSRASHGVDFGEGLDDQLRRVDAAAEDVNAELRRLDAAVKLDDGNVEALALKMRDMSEASQLAERRVELLQQKLSRMNAAGIGNLSDETEDAALAAQRAADAYDEASAAVTKLKGDISELAARQSLLEAHDDKGSDEYRELGEQIQAAKRQLDLLIDKQREAKATVDTANQVGEYRELQTQIAETRAQQTKLNDEMREMSRFSGVTQGSLVSLGMSLSTTVTPAITAMGYGMVDAANTIDAAYRDMRKTVNGTEEDFEELRQAAIEFSSTNVTSADQILSIQAIGGELGVATEDLKTFAETVSNLDVATDLNAEEAATSLGQLSNIISDLTGDKFPNFADALVRLGNNGASTESAIADVASRIGAMGSIVGMTTPEILAWASTIASTGQGSEAAGTAISRTMSDIETAVANGGDALDAFAEIAGVSAEEFARAWTDTPSAAMQDFIEGLVRVEDGGGSAITTLDELGITAVRQVQSIQGLMQMIEGLDDNLAMSRDAWNGVSDEWGAAGDAAREAERKAEGFSGSLSRLQNMAQNVGSELGESLAPVLDEVTDFLGDLYDGFVQMDDGTKRAIVGVGALIAALGPMLLLGKGIHEFFGGFADGIKRLRTAKEAASAVGDLASVVGSKAVSAFGDFAPAIEGVTTLLGSPFAKAAGVVAVGAVGALVAAFLHEQEEARKTKRATEDLAKACSVAREGMYDAAESTETYTERIFDAREGTSDMRDDLIKLADSFDEINRQASIDLNGLRRAESAVSDFYGRTDLTAQEVGEFKSAISELNDLCGTNYEVVRDAGGAYYVMEDGARKAKDEIYQLIDAQRAQVVADAQNKKLSEYYESQLEHLETYNQTSQDYVKALQDQEAARQSYIDKFGVDPTEGIQKGIGVGSEEAKDWGIAADAAANLNTQLEEQRGYVEQDQRNIDKLNASIGNLEAVADGAYDGIQALVMSRLNEAFAGDTDVMLDFAEALDEAGFSTKYLSELSDTQLTDLANAWQATGGDIEESMRLAGLAVTENVTAMTDSLREMSSSELTGLLSDLGMDVDEFAQALDRAGVKSDELSEVASEDFAAMAASCGGDIDKLAFMIQNYNATPIADKDGNINVSGEEVLLYANGQIYTWNGQYLKDQNGNIVVQGAPELHDANGEVYTWNSAGQLQDQHGNILINATELYDTNEEIYEFDGLNLYKDGQVVVDQLELTDAYDNCVKLTGYDLHLEGEVNVDYSEVRNAITAVDSLLSRNGRSMTVHVNTVSTTTNRVVEERVQAAPQSLAAPVAYQRMRSMAASSMSVPMSVPLETSLAASPLSRVRTSGLQDVARALADDPSSFSTTARRLVESSETARRGRASREVERKVGSVGTYVDKVEVNQKVVSADEDIYVRAPAAARSTARILGRLGR